jgi:hypothetical protein
MEEFLTMSGLAELKLPDPNFRLPRRKILSVEIVGSLSEKLQKRLEYPLVHVKQF